MPRQKQDRPKRTKCSTIESTSEAGQESSTPGDREKMNLDECNSSSSSSSTTSSSSSRSSSPQPTTIVNSIEKESGRSIISEDSPNNSSNHHLQTPLSPIREESFSQEANLESTPMITPQSHKQSSSSPPPPSLLLPQSPSHMSTEQTSTDPLTNEQTALSATPSTSSSMPQDSRASSSPQHSHSPSLCVASDVENEVNNATSIEENVADGTMEPPPTLPSTSSKQPLQSCIVRKRKVSTTDSMMAATATEKSPIIISSSSPTILPSSDQFVKPLTTESGNITSTLTSSSTTLKDKLSLISKPNNIDEKIIKDLNQSSLINSLILNSRTPGLIMPPQKPVPPPPPLSLAGISPTSLPSNSSSSQQKTQQQPIYVAISTNPLILVPLSYNSETGGLDLSINNSVGNVKLPEDILSNAQLNDPLAFERAALLGNTLEAHRNNNRNNSINGLFDSTNIINVNSLTNNNIISINNNTSDIKSIIDSRNTILNNINTDCPQTSRRPQSTEGPLDLSSNQSGDHQEKPAFRHHYRHENEFSSNLSTSATTLGASYKVKSEANLTMEESESPAPLNLFNSSSNFTSLASSSRDIPQSTSSVIAAAAAVAAAAAQASPSSGGATLPVPAASLPSPFAPEGVFKQSSYHCEHCHIGFYKKENYTIHKRHYCSARRTQAVAAAVAAAAAGGTRSGSGNNARTGSESSPDMLESEGSPNSSPEISLDSVKAERHRLPNVNSHRGSSRRVSVSSKTNASNSSNSPGSSPPHQPLSQYYCVACGIRFTSLDNLQAHQTYYCLKRNSVNSSPDKLQYIVSIPGGSGSEVSCVKCKATYCNEEAFLSHVCSAMNLGAISSATVPNITPNGSKSLTGSASSPNFNTNGNDGRCFSAGSGQSETDQQCFRCTICGYKGQTLQGMRIHVRMHSQCFRCTICGYKGHTLRGMRTHVRIHQDKIQGLPEETFIACIEDEALVAKSNRNGPSGPKRRRKSLEVFGAHSNVPHLYGFSSSVSENSKPTQLIGGLMPFSLATSAPTNTSTASGVLSVSLGSNNIGTMSSNDVNLSVNNNVNNLNSSHSEISSENDDEAASNISENETSGREDSRQGGSGESLHNCQFCYYSSTYKGNVVRHVKLVHKDVNSRNGPSPTASFSGLSKREINEDATGGDSMGSINDDLPLDLKSTRSNGLNGKLNRTGSPNNSEGSPVDQNVGNNGSINNSNLMRNNNSNSNGANNSNPSAQAKKAVPKYCRSCDISFQFLTSFIAHKKYYCSSHSNETNVIQSLPESKSPV